MVISSTLQSPFALIPRPISPDGPLCHASAQLYFDQFLSEGPFQSSVDQERTKLCGSSLQPLRGSASSVGLGVLLRRCATVASWIGCPRSLLTSCCVHAWQDRSRGHLRASPRSRALSWPTTRALIDAVRLIGVLSRCEERARHDCAQLHSCVCAKSTDVCSYQYSGVVWTHETFLGSLDSYN